MKEIANKNYVMLKESTLNSYSQIFFSSNKLFAGLLIVVTFFDLYAGISGLIAVIISNVAAYLIGFNRTYINAGYYGFNSLLVGLGLGIYYLPTPEYFMLLAFVALFTLFISVVLEGVIGKYALPYLSIPFLIVLWLAILATREFSALTISERGIYSANEMYAIGGIGMVKIYEWFTNLNLHESIVIYFRSLAAIFFQYSLFSGIIIAIGMLIYSRISFLLSLLGFFSAYLFYIVIGADINQLNYGYIGFNYILTAIAIGGFFIIPSKQSFLWVLLLTPLISIIIVSTSTILAFYQLSVYSLPFNFIVLVFLYVLKFRENPKLRPEVVAIQQNSPENNLYAHINHQSRFQDWKFVPISLPFWGNWKVSQGHGGEFTHKDKWKFAWDFQILGEDGETFIEEGKEVDDFLCYNKPVIAPADGWIEQIVNGITDNAIGDMNLEYNWGNSIVIKHSDKLYTQLSHLKNDSIKVLKGDYVKSGDVLASCGNSGRSPEPHLHFQVQSTPFVGSGTIDHPIANYIKIGKNSFDFFSYYVPKKDEIVSNIEKNDQLAKAFHFIPGQTLNFEVTISGLNEKKNITWEIQTDIFNNSVIFCPVSKSKAYFTEGSKVFYFTHFSGNKDSLLYYFYLGLNKVVTGFYKDLEIIDNYPLSILKKNFITILQDFIAPFYLFIKAKYIIKYVRLKEDILNSSIELESNAKFSIAKSIINKYRFKTVIENQQIRTFTIETHDKTIIAKLKNEKNEK